MRALKLLVIVMGVLLVAGIIALGFAVADRINHPRPAPGAAPARGETTIALPAGARLIATETSGDRLVARIGLADGGEELVIVNLGNGALVATIRLQPAAVP